MKKIIIALTILAGIIFAGCSSTPTPQTMESTAKAAGYAAGMISNSMKISDSERVVVIEIINKTSTCLPATNQTFRTAWTPIAAEHVSKLIAAGKLTKTKGELIEKAFEVACIGIDYLFDIRYPKARGYNDLIIVAVSGFNAGFMSTFKTDTKNVAADVTEYDKDAFEYIQNKIK